VPQLQHAVHEYHGPARALAGRLDTDLVQSLALLHRKLEDLERYLALAPPRRRCPPASALLKNSLRPRARPTRR